MLPVVGSKVTFRVAGAASTGSTQGSILPILRVLTASISGFCTLDIAVFLALGGSTLRVAPVLEVFWGFRIVMLSLVPLILRVFAVLNTVVTSRRRLIRT